MSWLTVVLIAALVQIVICEECKVSEMVYDGTFDEPQIFQPWTIVGFLPGGSEGVWKTIPSSNGFDLWKQGAEESPANDSSGNPTGQHLQINGNSNWAEISYEFNVPCLVGSKTAVFAFEYWFRPDWIVNNFGFSIQQEGQIILEDSFPEASGGWISSSHEFSIKACEPLKLAFTSNAQNAGGVHIDNVSLKVSVCSDVEMVTGGSFNEPVITKAWQKVAALPQGEGIWSTSPGTDGFVLWQQGAMGSPTQNSFGKSTGQHLELNGISPKAQVSYEFFVPFLLGVADSTLTFQYWFAPGDSVTFFGVSVEQGGLTVLNKSLTKGNKWKAASYTLDLQPGLPAHIYFTCSSGSIGGVHIDDVSLIISERRDAKPTVGDTLASNIVLASA